MIKHVKHHKKIKVPEISFAINSYEDIFSDFDLRPYEEKALSHDFLSEAKRATADKKPANLKLTFVLPSHKRNKKCEMVIRERLRNHFNKHYKTICEHRKSVTARGIKFLLIGTAIMLTAAYFFVGKSAYTISDKFLLILMEPAGWFLFWEGLDQIVFVSRDDPDYSFYEKMITCDIDFIGY